MLKINKKSRKDSRIINLTWRHLDTFELIIGDDKDHTVTILVGFDYEENSQEDKKLIGLDIGGDLWFRNYKTNDEETLFEFIGKFVTSTFVDYSKEDQNNLQKELMTELAFFSIVDSFKGSKND